MRKRIRQGVMTVEASFVVPLIIFTIVSLAYLCIYLCDSAMAAGIIDRHLNDARMNSLSSQTQLEELKKNIQEDLTSNLIGVNSITTEIENTNSSIKVRCKGRITIPIGWRRDLSFSIENMTTLYSPVESIRNIRRVVEAT